jgi:hypothetical protein
VWVLFDYATSKYIDRKQMLEKNQAQTQAEEEKQTF